MKNTLEVLLQLRAEGALAQFAIGGAVAASFYVEAVATEDLDIFAFLRAAPSSLLVLTPLYERLQQLGGVIKGEHVLLYGWPVQILPAYTPLVEEALAAALEQQFHDVMVPVIGADYLCAIALQTGRAKDYLRVNALLEGGVVNADALKTLVKKYALQDRWEQYVRRFS